MKEKGNKNMMNFIISISENMVWFIVGVFATLIFIVFFAICKILVEIWRERRKEHEFITFYEEEE